MGSGWNNYSYQTCSNDLNKTKETGNIKDHRGLTINTLLITVEILIKNRMMIATTGPRGTKTNMEKNET